MKKCRLLYNYGILLSSFAMLAIITKNIIAQQAKDTDYTMTE